MFPELAGADHARLVARQIVGLSDPEVFDLIHQMRREKRLSETVRALNSLTQSDDRDLGRHALGRMGLGRAG
jgi:hypothetical protein